MRLQKIFTDIEGDEKLYSVLMSEDELTIFSSKSNKFFSDGSDELEEIGKLGLGLGAGAGLAAGASKLYQGRQIKSMMKEGKTTMSHKEVMKRINDLSKSHKSSTVYNGLPSKKAAEHFVNAMNASKVSRIAGRGALVAGGLGALAYGASKLKNQD